MNITRPRSNGRGLCHIRYYFAQAAGVSISLHLKSSVIPFAEFYEFIANVPGFELLVPHRQTVTWSSHVSMWERVRGMPEVLSHNAAEMPAVHFSDMCYAVFAVQHIC